jgi:hypothetical protein
MLSSDILKMDATAHKWVIVNLICQCLNIFPKISDILPSKSQLGSYTILWKASPHVPAD